MKKVKVTLRQKIALIIFGFTFALVGVELFLRIIGAGYLSYRRGFDKDIVESKSSGYKILCLGDSFTFGVGAGRGRDYPSQLENMLNKSKLGKEFEVINRGIGGQNSSELLYYLDRNLEKYNPDLVIVMIGMNDGHNAHLHDWALGKKRWHTMLFSWIKELRVYKLFKFACAVIKKSNSKNEPELEEDINRKNKFEQEEIIQINSSVESRIQMKFVSRAIELFENGQNEEAKNLLIETVKGENVWEYINLAKEYSANDTVEHVIKKTLKDNPHDEWLRFTLGKTYLAQDKFDEAERVFEYILEDNPNNNYIRFDLAGLYLRQKKYAEAESLLKNAIEVHGESLRSSQFLSWCYEAQGNKVEADKFREKIKSYREITDINTFTIARKVLSRGIKLIIMNYPKGYPRGQCLSKETIEGITLIDNESVFNNFSEAERSLLFSADNHHCNVMGYKVIAENLFDYIIKMSNF